MPGSANSFQVDSDIAKAWTLPSSLYTDASVYALEKEKIFSRTWQVVGHANRVANPGDYFTIELLGEPLLIVRGADNKLRGFYNVCRHRAGPPAEGCGSRKLFRCGYHGWTYDLDGSLISATEIEGVEGFRPEDFALASVRTEEWFNFVFVNLDPDAPALVETLGELRQQAEKFPFAEMKLFERRTYDMKCNWKTYVDNYLEGYHLPSVHPGLNRELDYNAYVVEPYARHVRQFSPIRGAQPGDATPRRYQEAHADLTTDYFWIFPNWMLNCYPDNVSLNVVLPLEPERSFAIFEWYLPEKDHSSTVAKASVEFSDQIQIEDVAICEAVQKNLRSRSYSRGRFSVKQEKGVHAFHRMYAEIMSKG
ncbi:MAG TPA: aromatic ring-hydroxylating dioxygenase subunit alpha [Candidatus Sulfotelmatobacter sp.]|jgi:choline monooxygenase|nr:aromatic ring-hydroxylating dioxygenase subunit alpha [Candidatus Sulfotelmatobacter sp.]